MKMEEPEMLMEEEVEGEGRGRGRRGGEKAQ